MTTLRHHPLGQRLPDSPHAVVSSLPTMADVHGYEEHDPRVLRALKSGYPRFVVHEFVRLLVEHYMRREALSGRFGRLVSGRRAADDLLEFLGAGFEKLEADDGVFLVFCDASVPLRVHELKKFVQHTGCGISSRQAEDLLLRYGLLNASFEEDHFRGNAQIQVESELARRIGCRQSDVLVCASGMNAFYAGFRAVQEFNQSRGRTAWVQLGWLYLDSGKILGNFLNEGESLERVYDVLDVDAVLDRLRSLGHSLGAVVVECPSNPLLQVCDLERIASVVQQQGGVMIVDPTMASIYNVNVLPYADLMITSLTKYASIEGDVMIGALAVNPKSKFYGDLILRTSSFHVPPYGRDLSRLAAEMSDAPPVIEVINRNAERLSEFLRQHPAVRKVRCASCSEFIGMIARTDRPAGAVLTIELAGDMEKFYDAVRVMKGPSFGVRYTLVCPFMYLAHYDIVTSNSGRLFLKDVGIEADLIRISVGAESYGEIEAVFEEALSLSMK